MPEREISDANNVVELDVEERESVKTELLGNELVQAPSQPELAETEFDRQLPAAGDAE